MRKPSKSAISPRETAPRPSPSLEQNRALSAPIRYAIPTRLLGRADLVRLLERRAVPPVTGQDEREVQDLRHARGEIACRLLEEPALDPMGHQWTRQRERVTARLDRAIDHTGPGKRPSRASTQAIERLRVALWTPLRPSVASRVAEHGVACPEWLTAVLESLIYTIWIRMSFREFQIHVRPVPMDAGGTLELPPHEMPLDQALCQIEGAIRQHRGQFAGRRRPQNSGETTRDHASWAYARIVHGHTWDEIAAQAHRDRKAVSKGVDAVRPLLIGFTRLDPASK